MEKRHDSRWELNRAHSIEVHLDGRSVSLVNLSRGGVQILSPFLPPITAPLSIVIGSQVFEMDGRVVWSSECGSIPGSHQLGLVFMRPPGPFIAALECLLEVF